VTAYIKTNEGWGRSDEVRAYKEFWDEMMPTVANVVTNSFEEGQCPVSHVTGTEVKHRTNLAKDLVELMRKEFVWSKQRIRDNLALALRMRLNGMVVDLDSLGAAGRSSWI